MANATDFMLASVMVDDRSDRPHMVQCALESARKHRNFSGVLRPARERANDMPAVVAGFFIRYERAPQSQVRMPSMGGMLLAMTAAHVGQQGGGRQNCISEAT
jgi:hypothetical protein